MIKSAMTERLHRCIRTNDQFQTGLTMSLHYLFPPDDGNADFHADAVASVPALQTSPVTGFLAGRSKRLPTGSTYALRLSATFEAMAGEVSHVLLTDADDVALASLDTTQATLEEEDNGSSIFSTFQATQDTKTKSAAALWRVTLEFFRTANGAAQNVFLKQCLLDTALDPEAWDYLSSGATAWTPTLSGHTIATTDDKVGRADRRNTRVRLNLGASPSGTFTVLVDETAGGQRIISVPARNYAANNRLTLRFGTKPRTPISVTPIWGAPAPSFEVAAGAAFSGQLPAVLGDFTGVTWARLPARQLSWLSIASDGAYSGTVPAGLAAGRYYYGYRVSAGASSADILDTRDAAERTDGVVTVT